MPSVYVAGSSAEIERVERVIARLRDAGVRITHDWTHDVREVRAAGHASDADLSDDDAAQHAIRDLGGAFGARTFLLLAPETPTRGAWVELGAAWAHQRKWRGSIIVAGPAARQSIFTRLADRIVATDDEAVALITGASA